VQETTPPKLTRLDVLAVAALAAGVRVIYLIELSGDPFWDGLVSNAASYHEEAQWVAQGHRLPVTSGFQPLYGTLMGLVYMVFGPSLGAMRWLQVLLGAYVAAMVAHLAGRAAGRWAGLAAGAAWALYWPSVYYGGELLPDVLVTAGVISAAALCWHALARGRVWAWVGTGLCLGVTCLGKPNAVLMAPFAWAGAALWPGLDRAARKRQLLLATLVPVLAAAGVYGAPLMFSGYSPGITSAFAAKVMWDGNHSRADGTNPFYAEFPGVADWEIWDHPDDYEAIAEAFRSDLREFVTERPGGWLKLMGRKTVVYLSAHEVDGNGNVGWRRARSPMLRLPLWTTFGALLCLGLAGLVAVRHRWREHVWLVIWAAAWSGSIILIQVNGRYRLPCAAIACVYAGIGAAGLIDAARHRNRTELAAMLCAALVGTVVATADPLDLRHYSIAELTFQEARVLEDGGLLDEAEDHYYDSMHLQYGGPQLQSRLGLFLARQGRMDEALSHMRKATQRAPEFDFLFKDLGATLRDAGRTQEALDALLTAAELDPDDAGNAYNLGLVLGDLGRNEGADLAYTQAERLGYDDPELWLMRGVSRARLRQWEGAAADLTRAAGHEPIRCQAVRNLGWVLMAVDRPADAVDAWVTCSDDAQVRAALCGLPADAFGESVPPAVLEVCSGEE